MVVESVRRADSEGNGLPRCVVPVSRLPTMRTLAKYSNPAQPGSASTAPCDFCGASCRIQLRVVGADHESGRQTERALAFHASGGARRLLVVVQSDSRCCRATDYRLCLRLSHKSQRRFACPFRRDRFASARSRKPLERVCVARRFRSSRRLGLMRQPRLNPSASGTRRRRQWAGRRDACTPSFAAAVWEIVQISRLRPDRESEVCLPSFLPSTTARLRGVGLR